MRRAKIVCTLGPSAGTLEQLTALVDAGMNVARLNLSHGSYEDHEERYRNVRQVATTSGQAIGILVDLQGPKIRLGTFANGKEVLANGAQFTITTRDVAGDATDLRHHVQGPARRLQARRPDPGRRRQAVPGGRRGRPTPTW